jgi:hypothetical protein
MIDLVCNIANAIHAKIPSLTKSVYLAKIDDEGRVLVRNPESNEYQFAGIHDQDSAWFYIRFRNDGRIEYQSPSTDKKFASFQSFFQIRYKLRVVACLRGAEPWMFEEQLRSAVMNADLPSTATFANVSIIPVESIIDPVSVVIEESPGKKGRAFDKNLTIVAFDFDLVGDRDLALENYCDNPCGDLPC